MMGCKKKGAAVLALSLALLLSLAACGDSGGTDAVEPGDSARQTEEQTGVGELPGNSGVSAENWEDWKEGPYTTITLQGSSAAVDGQGAGVEGSQITITGAGTYVVEGVLEDGQILIEATKDDLVRLVLNGAEISSSSSAAIYAAKADRTVITLAQGTVNVVSDGAEYQYPDSDTDEPDAAIFCKDDLTINGTGSLTVNAAFHNGIGSKDDLVIEGGVIQVSAPNHGIRGRDSLTVLGGELTVQAGNDGLQSNNDAQDKGWILLSGGVFHIEADHDGVQAESSLTITGGDFTITSGGGSGASPADADGSYKGLKAGGDLVVEGGAFVLDCADDTLHAANITIGGGSFQLATGDDGMHADEALEINGGEIHISTSYEGLEGQTVTINGGTIRLVASDDGINAAGGSDGDGGEGRFGRDRFAASDNNHITINGGYIVVTASGDGIDSNGNITMNGGTLVVHGPTSGGDAALDFDGAFAINGGVIAAAGSSGMAQAPGDTSIQATLQVYFSSTQPGGTPVHLAAEDGTPLLTLVPEKEYQNVVFSLPQLAEGETYQVYTGGSAQGLEDGFSLEGDYTPGELVVTASLSGATTRISDTGEAVSGFMGMGGGFGGGRPGGGMGGMPSGQAGEGPGGDRAGAPPEGGPGGEWPAGGPGGDAGERQAPPGQGGEAG